jgi:predicted AAA+ superfamily ATPase
MIIKLLFPGTSQRQYRALKTFPVVILTGARQTGKRTLILELLPESSRNYRTLDDIDVLDLTEREPEALVFGKRPIAIDEIQRSPKLLLAIRRAVDRERKLGRYLLRICQSCTAPYCV